jgi:protein phosphatase
MAVLEIPEGSLVVLVGVSGCGKSSLARAHFRPTEVVSSDVCRGLVSDDEADQSASKDAFEVLHLIVRKRLEARRVTVVDATNVHRDARASLLALAREADAVPLALVLDLPLKLCQARNEARARQVGGHVLQQQSKALRQSLDHLKKEGFVKALVLRSPEEVEALELRRVPLRCDQRSKVGPFDLIGDVHGCREELEGLLGRLGYALAEGAWRHPEGRTAVFVGDLVDRGPDSMGVVALVRAMHEAGSALCVPGNHDQKFMKWLQGRKVTLNHGLDLTVAQAEGMLDADARASLERWLRELPAHLVLDEGRLVVAHAGLPEALHRRASDRVREFALYGEVNGERDEHGLPVRGDWWNRYEGKATVVFGHTPVVQPAWVNKTLCIDTGCVFGGSLTALRWPERELLSEPARQAHAHNDRPPRDMTAPWGGAKPEAQEAGEVQAPEVVRGGLEADPWGLDLSQVTGRRTLETRLIERVVLPEGQTAAALETVSRFAEDPRWLIYVPPTMSPCETAPAGSDALEHPREAFAYYAKQGVEEVVCQEKHMGSRAVVVLCKDAQVAERRFGDPSGRLGVVTTRTGRPFFSDKGVERGLLERLGEAVSTAGLWEELGTDWLCLDAELMPWSAKAQDLLRTQYAPVGASSRASMGAAVEALRAAVARGLPAQDLLALTDARRDAVERYTDAYRRYCWPVEGLDDLKLAPFHLMASEGKVYTDRDHVWHMETLARLCVADPGLLRATRWRLVQPKEPESVQAGIAWWEEMTGAGGEGMVVKPRAWVQQGPKGLVQPAVKCRGREYLRIIYGPEYALPHNLERLRSRGLGAKRAMALREFALGVEGLSRFVERAPLRRVHECAFGVLALEAEAVDPRL